MFKYPLVSVIIPCYNYGHFLCETLENILQQTYQNLECIIVDDGSTDNTNEIVQSYITKDARFRYFRQTNKGTSSAKNNGIRIATGEFIQFLDADDLLNKKKLEVQVLFLINNPDVDIIYGDVRYFDIDNPTRRSKSLDLKDQAWMPNVSGKDEVILKPLLINNIMVISAPLIRRKVYQDKVR
jgi:glycosyltransferase involved in cell wall biosynthesis